MSTTTQTPAPRDSSTERILRETDEDAVLGMLAGILAIASRTGPTSPRIQRVAQAVAKELPTPRAGVVGDSILDFDRPAHIATIWREDPDFSLDKRPMPLLKHGPHPSLTSLFARIEPALDIEKGLQYLLDLKMVTYSPPHYVLSNPYGLLRGFPAYQARHELRVLFGKLLTFENNNQPREAGRSWVDMTADCYDFPESELAEFHDYLTKRAYDFTDELDSYMFRRARMKPPGAPSVHLAVGTSSFQLSAQTRLSTPAEYLAEIQHNARTTG